MSLKEMDVIDGIGLDEEKDCVTLALIDGEDWTDEEEHLFLLQEKLNSYLSFIESGEIFAAYEEAQGKEIEIIIQFNHDIPESCKDFLEQVKEIVQGAGFGFEYHIDA